MKIIPQNNFILCEKNDRVANDTGNIVIDNQSFNLYKILKCGIGCDSKTFKKDDVIVVNATGTKVKIENEIFYLFDEKSIMAKVC